MMRQRHRSEVMIDFAYEMAMAAQISIAAMDNLEDPEAEVALDVALKLSQIAANVARVVDAERKDEQDE